MTSWQSPHTRRLSIWGLLAVGFILRPLPTVQAQGSNALGITTNPTNDTASLTAAAGSLRYLLSSTVLRLPPVQLAPLTAVVSSPTNTQFERFSESANLTLVDPANPAAANSAGIIFVSCDPGSYSGYIGAGATVSNLIVSDRNLNLQAVILYSVQVDHCNYTATDPDAESGPVFTVLGAITAQTVYQQLQTHSNNTSVSIGPDMSSGNGNPDTSSTATGSVASPTTAVAMIILYSITGIITALFLGIIVTGAVRAHRNPERYGPRNIVGRPRQSRARGVARAMLETIPIVKFGSEEERHAEAVKGDVELASRHDGEGPDPNRTSVVHSDDEAVQTAEAVTETPQTPHAEHDVTTTANASATSLNRDATTAIDGGNHVCPICTDDFVKGQDVRVLPCSHQFHPECIDPWLINVSGTCPLCRIDLNPTPEANAETEGNQEDGEPAAQQESPNAPAHPAAQDERSYPGHHRGFAGYLSEIRRVRNASVEERLAALRRLRQSSEQQRDVTGAAADTPDASEQNQTQRRRLTARFRDRFRIRTRQVEEPAPRPSSPPLPAHTPPAL